MPQLGRQPEEFVWGFHDARCALKFINGYALTSVIPCRLIRQSLGPFVYRNLSRGNPYRIAENDTL